MKKLLTYQWLLLALLSSVFMLSCGPKKKKVLDKRVTLKRTDKIPYGAWYAYENLQHIFPDATVDVDNGSQMRIADKNTAYIIIYRHVLPTEEEANTMGSFIAEGGHLFLSAWRFNNHILDSLHLEMSTDFFSQQRAVTIDDPVTAKTDTFSYPGMPFEAYFSKIDSSITTVLGHNIDGKPNFLKFTYNNGGVLYLHCAPLALSNFFLLHKDNKRYYDAVMSHMPSTITDIQWNEYYRTHRKNEDDKFSALGWLRDQPSLAAAMWLLLLLALLVYLFESKRKQRVVPVRPPLKNATVEFARTVGRLYLQRKDNNNLAYKMAAIFMDHVRRKFNVRTTMDDEFIEKLSHKSGYDKEALANLLYQLKYAQAHEGVSDLELLELQQKLDHFYQHT